MAKQIKLGFDKIPVPATTTYEQLYDLNTGVALKNSEGKPLYTEEISPVSTYGNASRATSVVVNNTIKNPLRTEEIFAETSQVSSSLLGVPRAEVQLSLFSDVSTYGIDENNWEFFSYNSGIGGNEPIEWYTRNNFIFGNRFYTKLEEFANEQALAITSYPVPWTFPYGPKFREIGSYNENAFEKYKNFIKLGNQLYDFYVGRGFTDFAEANFLSNVYVSIDENEDVFYNTIEYRTEVVFEKIETWTINWMKIRDNELFDPQNDKISFLSGFNATNSSPGYSAQRRIYGQLESRRVYRYQPGRISGFTFGIRASTDAGSLSNIIEWGCCNESDEYVFQIKGSQFNIVRRSKIPLPKENIERMGLKEEDQVLKLVNNPLRSSSVQNTTTETTGEVQETGDELYELVIPRDFFNGDSLDGNGPSGYIISFEQVTMYKIEFSWYGAIGAKFYAYIPFGNQDARWVLIHSIIIENQLGQPCLKDPFFKFRYSLIINDTSNLRQPQYIYKYGASYYIDGGDEGTTTIHSYSSNIIQTGITSSRSVIGIKAKDVIANSRGETNKNRKDVIPQKLSISSTSPARIDVIECEGCPGGFGYFYAPSLIKGTTGITGTLTIASTGTDAGKKINFEPTDTNLTEADWLPQEGELIKIISPGLYSSYFDENKTIFRIVGSSRVNNLPVSTEGYSTIPEIRLPDGTLVDPKNYEFTDTRLSRYSLIASTVKLTKKRIYINFLNPIARDSGYYADFFIGVTSKEPTVPLTGDNEGKLLLNQDLPAIKDLFFAEFTQYTANKNREGFDVGEIDGRYGIAFEIDPIIKRPPGFDSGECSRAEINISNVVISATYSTINPVNGSAGNFLIFETGLINQLGGLLGGEVGVPDLDPGEFKSSGAFFLQNSATIYQVGANTRYYVAIDNSLPDANINEISVRFLTMTGRYINITKSFNWNIYPLYVIMGLRDGARINNITFTEEDELGTFTHTPVWIADIDSPITVVNSGNLTERTNPVTGLFEAGGLSEEANPPANFKENYRLDSAQVDTQLQQPLRPGEVRGSIFIGANETTEFDLTHLFGADRYVITPGLTNTKATFITAKSLEGAGEVQISVVNKEQ